MYNEGANKSFISKVCTLGSIQHINLIHILGYRIKGLKHMLVYEYMSNSFLDKWFYEDNLLDWDKWLCIIIVVTKGLAHGLHPKIGWFWINKNYKWQGWKCGMCPIVLFIIMCVQLQTLQIWTLLWGISFEFHIFIVIGHGTNTINNHNLKWTFEKHLM